MFLYHHHHPHRQATQINNNGHAKRAVTAKVCELLLLDRLSICVKGKVKTDDTKRILRNWLHYSRYRHLGGSGITGIILKTDVAATAWGRG